MFCISDPAERFISSQPWFAGLPSQLQHDIRTGVQLTEGSKGDVMLALGSPAQGWHAVLNGLVMLRSPACQQRSSSAFIGIPDGEWFGEGTAMKAESLRYEVVALRPTQLLCLPLPLFKNLQDTSLAFNQYLSQHLNLRLGQAMAIIDAGRNRSPEHRVALTLSRLFWRSTRRLKLTQEELGQLAGLSRQTVNRTLQALEAQGIVTLDFGSVAIVDDAALNAHIAATAAR